MGTRSRRVSEKAKGRRDLILLASVKERRGGGSESVSTFFRQRIIIGV